MTTAILALQGAFAEHERALDELGENWLELRGAGDLNRPFDRLVLPGGESTVQGKLLAEEGMLEPLREMIEGDMPVLGTCAGLILLARGIVDKHGETSEAGRAHHFGTMDVVVERNAFGRQLESFCATAPFEGVGEVGMTFIRAPRIIATGSKATVLARVGDDIVAARDGKQVGIAFHPEIDDELRIHEYFLGL